ncbi:uncharacterized protein ARMOST_18418 [Armillaria ostoyae]|uniref:Uncharacterized protein n=1 Tax=Armillaria ostoyae TaxID=47428 RepID=A0A284S1Q0_ARMOS|nr:uncharacterized protein ARMOST_18418 [Armillaria ostoyae]
MPNGEVARVVIMEYIEGDEWAKQFGKHVSPPEHIDSDYSSDEEEYDNEDKDEDEDDEIHRPVSRVRRVCEMDRELEDQFVKEAKEILRLLVTTIFKTGWPTMT